MGEKTGLKPKNPPLPPNRPAKKIGKQAGGEVRYALIKKLSEFSESSKLSRLSRKEENQNSKEK